MPAFKPHPYQQRGINWILDHKACGLFLPMGSGKTATTLTALEDLLHNRWEVSRVLIIGPKRVIETTWPDEIDKWDLDIQTAIIAGTAKQRTAAMNQDADVYLVSKDNLQWLIEKAGKGWKWDMVVIDELSLFKNPQAKRFKALRTVLPKVRRFVGLTGTPTPKGIPDLWSQIYLMDRGERLGRTLGAFRERYLYPARQNGYTVYTWGLQAGAEKEIQDRLKDICMSIDAAEYATLPDVQYLDIKVDLGPAKQQYDKFKREMVLWYDEHEKPITAANAGVLCMKLGQMASGQIYNDPLRHYLATGEDPKTPTNDNILTIHDHKLQALQDLMTAANGQPVLVFYWYQHEGDRLRKSLQAAGYTGKNIKDPDAIKDWNAGALDYLLLQPGSAGHGLNLQTGGHIAVWYSLPNWSLELYQQANARIYRQGQKEKVTIYHLLAKGTVDIDQMAALQTKGDVQDAMLAALKR